MHRQDINDRLLSDCTALVNFGNHVIEITNKHFPPEDGKNAQPVLLVAAASREEAPGIFREAWDTLALIWMAEIFRLQGLLSQIEGGLQGLLPGSPEFVKLNAWKTKLTDDLGLFEAEKFQLDQSRYQKPTSSTGAIDEQNYPIDAFEFPDILHRLRSLSLTYVEIPTYFGVNPNDAQLGQGGPQGPVQAPKPMPTQTGGGTQAYVSLTYNFRYDFQKYQARLGAYNELYPMNTKIIPQTAPKFTSKKELHKSHSQLKKDIKETEEGIEKRLEELKLDRQGKYEAIKKQMDLIKVYDGMEKERKELAALIKNEKHLPSPSAVGSASDLYRIWSANTDIEELSKKVSEKEKHFVDTIAAMEQRDDIDKKYIKYKGMLEKAKRDYRGYRKTIQGWTTFFNSYNQLVTMGKELPIDSRHNLPPQTNWPAFSDPVPPPPQTYTEYRKAVAEPERFFKQIDRLQDATGEPYNPVIVAIHATNKWMVGEQKCLDNRLKKIEVRLKQIASEQKRLVEEGNPNAMDVAVLEAESIELRDWQTLLTNAFNVSGVDVKKSLKDLDSNSKFLPMGMVFQLGNDIYRYLPPIITSLSTTYKEIDSHFEKLEEREQERLKDTYEANTDKLKQAAEFYKFCDDVIPLLHLPPLKTLSITLPSLEKGYQRAIRQQESQLAKVTTREQQIKALGVKLQQELALPKDAQKHLDTVQQKIEALEKQLSETVDPEAQVNFKLTLNELVEQKTQFTAGCEALTEIATLFNGGSSQANKDEAAYQKLVGDLKHFLTYYNYHLEGNEKDVMTSLDQFLETAKGILGDDRPKPKKQAVAGAGMRAPILISGGQLSYQKNYPGLTNLEESVDTVSGYVMEIAKVNTPAGKEKVIKEASDYLEKAVATQVAPAQQDLENLFDHTEQCTHAYNCRVIQSNFLADCAVALSTLPRSDGKKQTARVNDPLLLKPVPNKQTSTAYQLSRWVDNGLMFDTVRDSNNLEYVHQAVKQLAPIGSKIEALLTWLKENQPHAVDDHGQALVDQPAPALNMKVEQARQELVKALTACLYRKVAEGDKPALAEADKVMSAPQDLDDFRGQASAEMGQEMPVSQGLADFHQAKQILETFQYQDWKPQSSDEKTVGACQTQHSAWLAKVNNLGPFVENIHHLSKQLDQFNALSKTEGLKQTLEEKHQSAQEIEKQIQDHLKIQEAYNQLLITLEKKPKKIKRFVPKAAPTSLKNAEAYQKKLEKRLVKEKQQCREALLSIEKGLDNYTESLARYKTALDEKITTLEASDPEKQLLSTTVDKKKTEIDGFLLPSAEFLSGPLSMSELASEAKPESKAGHRLFYQPKEKVLIPHGKDGFPDVPDITCVEEMTKRVAKVKALLAGKQTFLENFDDEAIKLQKMTWEEFQEFVTEAMDYFEGSINKAHAEEDVGVLSQIKVKWSEARLTIAELMGVCRLINDRDETVKIKLLSVIKGPVDELVNAEKAADKAGKAVDKQLYLDIAQAFVQTLQNIKTEDDKKQAAKASEAPELSRPADAGEDSASVDDQADKPGPEAPVNKPHFVPEKVDAEYGPATLRKEDSDEDTFSADQYGDERPADKVISPDGKVIGSVGLPHDAAPSEGEGLNIGDSGDHTAEKTGPVVTSPPISTHGVQPTPVIPVHPHIPAEPNDTVAVTENRPEPDSETVYGQSREQSTDLDQQAKKARIKAENARIKAEMEKINEVTETLMADCRAIADRDETAFKEINTAIEKMNAAIDKAKTVSATDMIAGKEISLKAAKTFAETLLNIKTEAEKRAEKAPAATVPPPSDKAAKKPARAEGAPRPPVKKTTKMPTAEADADTIGIATKPTATGPDVGAGPDVEARPNVNKPVQKTLTVSEHVQSMLPEVGKATQVKLATVQKPLPQAQPVLDDQANKPKPKADQVSEPELAQGTTVDQVSEPNLPEGANVDQVGEPKFTQVDRTPQKGHAKKQKREAGPARQKQDRKAEYARQKQDQKQEYIREVTDELHRLNSVIADLAGCQKGQPKKVLAETKKILAEGAKELAPIGKIAMKAFKDCRELSDDEISKLAQALANKRKANHDTVGAITEAIDDAVMSVMTRLSFEEKRSKELLGETQDQAGHGSGLSDQPETGPEAKGPQYKQRLYITMTGFMRAKEALDDSKKAIRGQAKDAIQNIRYAINGLKEVDQKHFGNLDDPDNPVKKDDLLKQYKKELAKFKQTLHPGRLRLLAGRIAKSFGTAEEELPFELRDHTSSQKDFLSKVKQQESTLAYWVMMTGLDVVSQISSMRESLEIIKDWEGYKQNPSYDKRAQDVSKRLGELQKLCLDLYKQAQGKGLQPTEGIEIPTEDIKNTLRGLRAEVAGLEDASRLIRSGAQVTTSTVAHAKQPRVQEGKEAWVGILKGLDKQYSDLITELENKKKKLPGQSDAMDSILDRSQVELKRIKLLQATLANYQGNGCEASQQLLGAKLKVMVENSVDKQTIMNLSSKGDFVNNAQQAQRFFPTNGLSADSPKALPKDLAGGTYSLSCCTGYFENELSQLKREAQEKNFITKERVVQPSKG